MTVEVLCQRCGMCCTFPDPNVKINPELTDEDLVRLHEHNCDDLIVHLDGRAGIRSVTAYGQSRCAALEFDEVNKPSCSIYYIRPAVCREWEPGCALCQQYARLNRRGRKMLKSLPGVAIHPAIDNDPSGH